MTDVLKKPPLIEAICQFRFESDNWDWAIPGIIYEKVKEQFPQRQQTPPPDRTALEENEDAAVLSGRVKFLSSNKKSSVVVGRDFLGVGCRKPYIGWEKFKPQILQVLESYKQAAQPEFLTQVQLRYVNAVFMPGEGIQHFEDYLNIYPQMPRLREITCKDWFQKVNLFEESINSMLSVHAATRHVRRRGQWHNVVMLDFSVSPLEESDEESDEGSEIEIEAWLEGAHNAIERLFQESFTEKGWSLFQPEEK